MSAHPTIAYKVLTAGQRAELETGTFAGAPIDLADGYIHMSTSAQLAETARRHFAGRGDLLLLTVDLSRFGDDLIWEPSRGGDLFPHLYAPLPVATVTASRAFSVTADGEMAFEDAQ